MSVLLDVLGPADDDTTIWTLAPVARTASSGHRAAIGRR